MAEPSNKDGKLPDPVELSHNMAEIAERSQRLVADFLQRQHPSEPGTGMGIGDPLNIGSAFFEMTARMMADPAKLVQAQISLWNDYLTLWQRTAQRFLGGEAEPIVEPPKGDRRFRDEAWTDNTLFDFIKQSYLLTARWMQSTVKDVEGLDDKTARKVDFYTRQFVDAMAPSNFLMTNPEVLKATLDSGGENLVKGLQNLLDDLERGKGRLAIKMTDMDAFRIGENIAVTPGKVVYQNDLLQLIQYQPTTEMVKRRPLLIIPPWINKFYILDLRPDNSFIRWAVGQGHTVFVVSWVNPGEHLAQKTFEDYMIEGPLAALDAMEAATGEREANVIGYCLGGTLLAATLAYMTAKGDDRIKSATYLVTMVDFAEAGELSVFIDEEQLAALEERMKTTGYLEGRDMATTFNMLRANDLIWSFVVNNYLLGKDPFPFDLLYLSAQHVSGEQAGRAGGHQPRRRPHRSHNRQGAKLSIVDAGGPYRAVEIDLCRDENLRRPGQIHIVGLRPHRRGGQSARQQIRPLGEQQDTDNAGQMARKRDDGSGFVVAVVGEVGCQIWRRLGQGADTRRRQACGNRGRARLLCESARRIVRY